MSILMHCRRAQSPGKSAAFAMEQVTGSIHDIGAYLYA